MYQFIERFKYIVIEGPIGAGKTSLASKIALQVGAGLILEDAAQNPFLKKFYESQGQNALATQLHFYFQRLDQLHNTDVFQKNPHAMGDYMFGKNDIFAQLTLNEDEKNLYQRACREIVTSKNLPQPGLIIWLQAPVPALLARIRQRGIGMERLIHENYLSRLSQAYSHFFQQYCGAPVFAVNTEKLNPIDNAAHYTLLLERLNNFRGGREFFNPQV